VKPDDVVDRETPRFTHVTELIGGVATLFPLFNLPFSYT